MKGTDGILRQQCRIQLSGGLGMDKPARRTTHHADTRMAALIRTGRDGGGVADRGVVGKSKEVRATEHTSEGCGLDPQSEVSYRDGADRCG